MWNAMQSDDNQYPDLLPPPPPPPPLYGKEYDSTSSDAAQQYDDYANMPAGYYTDCYEPNEFYDESCSSAQPNSMQQEKRGRGKHFRGLTRGHQLNQGNKTKPTGLTGPWQQNKNPNLCVTTKPGTKKQVSACHTMLPIPDTHSQKIKTDQSPGNLKTSKTAGNTEAETAKHRFLAGLMNLKDEPYPKELLAMFSPLKCDLCVAKMNSTMQSKMHYSGKTHRKKTHMFMENWKKNHGEPIAKRPKLENDTTATEVVPSIPPQIIYTSPAQVATPGNAASSTQVAPSAKVATPVKAAPVSQVAPLVQAAYPTKKETPEKKQVALYCQCCDLSFTSTLHAEQHYMGRNHQKVLQGRLPAKANYFNPTSGLWQTKPLTAGCKVPLDVSGRFGIGVGFQPEKSAEPDIVTPAVPPELMKGKYYCVICDVGATSQDQLNVHLNGSRHRKMLGVQPVTGSKDQNGSKTIQDLSLVRTPSGKFYCQQCNLSLNSESQFAAHTESKKHKLKCAIQKPAMVLTGPTAAKHGK